MPGKPDCDYYRGETPLTREQITELMTSYKNYKIVDYDHNYTHDGKWYLRQLGEPLKIWQSTEETRYIDMFDVERTTPPGTWWQTTKITDPETIQLLDEGKLFSYSLTIHIFQQDIIDKKTTVILRYNIK